MNIRAWLNILSTGSYTLPIVTLYVTEGCNLKCVMCSYRDSLPNELSLLEIENLASRLHEYGLRHIVYSGGEPLTRRDFPLICKIFSRFGVKQTLLTNGLLLEKRLDEIQNCCTEIIVSLDGATPDVHNAIRGVDSFDLILRGIRKAVSMVGTFSVSIRCVIQKKNFREIGEIVDLAKSLSVHRVSFLAADVFSGSFGRKASGVPSLHAIALDDEETEQFRILVEQLITEHPTDFEKHFISESQEKLRHIVNYFKALNGKHDFPRTTCNAPMTSAVITATGEILPCFFLPSWSNIHEHRVDKVLQSFEAQLTREQVKSYSLERCKTCVCTLNIRPVDALLDKF